MIGLKPNKAQKAYKREVPWDVLTVAMKFFHDRTQKERDLIFNQHEQIEGKGYHLSDRSFSYDFFQFLKYF